MCYHCHSFSHQFLPITFNLAIFGISIFSVRTVVRVIHLILYFYMFTVYNFYFIKVATFLANQIAIILQNQRLMEKTYKLLKYVLEPQCWIVSTAFRSRLNYKRNSQRLYSLNIILFNTYSARIFWDAPYGKPQGVIVSRGNNIRYVEVVIV